MSRITRVMVLAASVVLATSSVFAAAPPATAVPTNKVDDYLSALWTTVLETPSAQNPFGAGGDEYECLDLGGTVAPFAPVSADSCTVKPGTKLFIVAHSVECSTFEGNGTTEAELRACAIAGDPDSDYTVTVDGKAVPVVEAETPLLDIVLPDDNIFGEPGGSEGLSVGHGWVALLHPLTPGSHTILIDESITTTIIVTPHR
ncbi:hypothetical protein ACPW96_07565 [Micromonospora sp. DT81.3]|uniref:hypothetical protein n=1 Tax=Micromonospora sp. DT81.3 TaxID=3416523 RepID=UPI003CE9D611